MCLHFDHRAQIHHETNAPQQLNLPIYPLYQHKPFCGGPLLYFTHYFHGQPASIQTAGWMNLILIHLWIFFIHKMMLCKGSYHSAHHPHILPPLLPWNLWPHLNRSENRRQLSPCWFLGHFIHHITYSVGSFLTLFRHYLCHQPKTYGRLHSSKHLKTYSFY